MIEKDFLAQILATPDDDSLRLVYADWLEEQGNLDRAQFIRARSKRRGKPRPCSASVARSGAPSCRVSTGSSGPTSNAAS